MDFKRSDFPQDFLFGAATAAYQIEGTHKQFTTIWDHHEDLISDHSNCDIACDFHTKYEEDIEYIKDLDVELRYYTANNFVGDTIDGYKSNRLIITQATAKKLKLIQNELFGFPMKLMKKCPCTHFQLME